MVRARQAMGAVGRAVAWRGGTGPWAYIWLCRALASGASLPRRDAWRVTVAP